MKLLVDVGNSRVKWAFGTADRLVDEGELAGDPGEALAPLLDCRQAPDEIRIANVAGPETGIRIARMLAERFGRKPVLAASAAAGAGVSNGYRDPAQLGVDRWLAICAAYSRYRGPVCVVDSGTATTIDLVTASGEHQGGFILPGIALMQRALLRETGNLARLAAATDAQTEQLIPVAGAAQGQPDGRVLPGRDTSAAIRQGALQATACFVRQCMEQLCVAKQGGGVLVVTGGAAADLQAELRRLDGFQGPEVQRGHRLEHRRLLVLEGLALDPPCFTVAG